MMRHDEPPRFGEAGDSYGRYSGDREPPEKIRLLL
jgi:hypothetical protein